MFAHYGYAAKPGDCPSQLTNRRGGLKWGCRSDSQCPRSQKCCGMSLYIYHKVSSSLLLAISINLNFRANKTLIDSAWLWEFATARFQVAEGVLFWNSSKTEIFRYRWYEQTSFNACKLQLQLYFVLKIVLQGDLSTTWSNHAISSSKKWCCYTIKVISGQNANDKTPTLKTPIQKSVAFHTLAFCPWHQDQIPNKSVCIHAKQTQSISSTI